MAALRPARIALPHIRLRPPVLNQGICGMGEALPAARSDDMTAPIDMAEEWNAGELGCGELVLELRKILRRIPGSVLKVVAHDPAAPVDLPAWCRLTRNALVDHDPRSHAYWIRSRLDWS
jgi:tRNA 2-thiouridine synthesizing protein A